MATIGLPEQLNFDKAIPLDGNCRQEEVTTVPITGVSSYLPGSYFIINIPRTAPNCVFDPNNSFLRFRVVNNNAADGATLRLDHSVDCLFSRVEILMAGNPIEVIDNYASLSAMLTDISVEPNYRATVMSLLKGCNFTVGDPTGVTIAGAEAKYFSTTLISGVVGSLARSYIPIFALDGPIQIKITLVNNVQAGFWSATPTANFSIDNIEYHANMIRLSDSVMSMIQSPSYTIYSEGWSNYNALVAQSTTSLEQLIPCRYSSLKTVLVAMRLQTNVNNAGSTSGVAFPLARSTMSIQDWAFRLGSLVIPPQRCKGSGSGHVESYEQLKKAFHCGGNIITTFGVLRADNYVDSTRNASGVNVLSSSQGCHVLGCDMEVYSGKSGSILSGINTSGNDLYFSATFPSAGIASIALFDYMLHYDMVLKIENGIMTVHV